MAETRRSLNITGYDNKPINNTLRSTGSSDRIAIVFPGIGYTCWMPLLYYTANFLLKKGYDVLLVEYDYKNDRFKSSSAKEKVDWLNFDAEASHKAAMAEGKYRHVLLLGKSLGTFALVHLNNTVKGVGESVWLTPLIGKSGAVGIEMYDKIKGVCKNGLFIIGTADPGYDKAKIERLEALGAKFLCIEHADHSLEIENDPRQSLKALELVVNEIDKLP
jgi:hypothetical protein